MLTGNFPFGSLCAHITFSNQNPSINVFDSPSCESNVIWASGGNPFLRVGNGTNIRPPISNGNYQLEEILSAVTTSMSLTKENVNTIAGGNFVSMTGKLLGSESAYDYSFRLEQSQMPNSQTIGLEFSTSVTLVAKADPVNRIFLSYETKENEKFYGFGESFTFFNLKGKRVPILVSEQGLGRGLEPLTDYMNTNKGEGVGGHW